MRRSVWTVVLCATAVAFSSGCGARKDGGGGTGEANRDSKTFAPEDALSRQAFAKAEGNWRLGIDMKPGVLGGKDGKGKQQAKSEKLKTWKRSDVVPNMSRLKVGDNDYLPLKGMQVNVQIDGFRARVVLDCFFLNTKARRLEGTFQLRLPNEASLDFLAFGETKYQANHPRLADNAFNNEDNARRSTGTPQKILSIREETWNQPKVARVVPKNKASIAYGETVRRRIDPALAEWAGAGVFNARVFPLAPHKLHRVVVGYDVNLLRAGDDLVYKLDLPNKVPELVVDLNVATLPGSEIELSPKHDEPFDGKTFMHYRFENPKEDRISVRLRKPGTMLLTGAEPDSGDYFATRIRPNLPKAATAGSPRGLFLVDVSLSSNPQRFNIWLKMLEAVLNNNRDTLKQFAVGFFNIDTFWWKPAYVDNTPANVAALLKYANGLSLEGATNLQRALKTAVQPAWQKADDKQQPADLFLMSDAAPTWGDGDLHALTQPWRDGKAGPLFAYSTGITGTDTRVLAHLARETGGAVFSVVGEAEVKTASTAHRARPWELLGIELAGGNDLLLAGRPKSVYPGQQLLLVGRGKPEANADVVMKLRRGDEQRTVKVKFDHAINSILTPRVYGQVAVGQLEELKEATDEYSAAYARHFRVAGQTCSLLMLDSEADYKRYNIVPREDAFVVKSNTAGKIVERIHKKLANELGHPKAQLMSWLRKLEQAEGLQFRMPTALRVAIDKMPDSSFQVAPSALNIAMRNADGVPRDIRNQLKTKKLIYDDITNEAERRAKAFRPADGLLALSSLVENSPGDTVLARDVGYAALKWNLGGEAYHLFRRVSIARPYEPQTYYAMARCLSQMQANDLAMVWYEVALAGKWNPRFGQLKKIVGLEYLRLLHDVDNGRRKTSVPQFAKARLQSMSSQFDPGKADLVMAITWNTDGTDVDLHVTEPNGETCYYEHTRTRRGGRITRDITRGYGPEMYQIRDAEPGDYRVRVKYFASDANRTATRTKVYVTIYQHWGTARERVTRKAVTLRGNREMHEVASVGFK